MAAIEDERTQFEQKAAEELTAIHHDHDEAILHIAPTDDSEDEDSSNEGGQGGKGGKQTALRFSTPPRDPRGNNNASFYASPFGSPTDNPDMLVSLFRRSKVLPAAFLGWRTVTTMSRRRRAEEAASRRESLETVFFAIYEFAAAFHNAAAQARALGHRCRLRRVFGPWARHVVQPLRVRPIA